MWFGECDDRERASRLATWELVRVNGPNQRQAIEKMVRDGIDPAIGGVANPAPEPLAGPVLDRFVSMAARDPSGQVRLGLASALQRLPLSQREPLATALVGWVEDAGDHNLPAMVWYGVSPLADSAPDALVRLAARCPWPDTLRWIAQALAGEVDRYPEELGSLLAAACEGGGDRADPVLTGVVEGLRGRRRVPPPPG